MYANVNRRSIMTRKKKQFQNHKDFLKFLSNLTTLLYYVFNKPSVTGIVKFFTNVYKIIMNTPHYS